MCKAFSMLDLPQWCKDLDWFGNEQARHKVTELMAYTGLVGIYFNDGMRVGNVHIEQ